MPSEGGRRSHPKSQVPIHSSEIPGEDRGLDGQMDGQMDGQNARRVGAPVVTFQVQNPRPHLPSRLLLPLCMLFLVSCVPAPAPATLQPPTSTLQPPTSTLPPPTPSLQPPTSTLQPPTSTLQPPLSNLHPPTPTPHPSTANLQTPASSLQPPPANLVANIVAQGRARLEAQGVEPLCLNWEDADGDGESEWVGLYHRPGDPPQLRAFVLDGDVWHELLPLEKEKHGLGAYPTCEMAVHDVNADGRVEILVWGHADSGVDLLHIFAWDGSAYVLLAPFEGEAGVRLENKDGDLADEVVVGYDAGTDLVWEAVYTWDGANYGWTWERYDWFYLSRPHAYPSETSEHAVISFYLAVDDRDLPGAYGLLSGPAQAAQPYEAWAAGFATTVAAEVGSVHEIARDGETASVAGHVRAYDNVDGRIVATLWDVKWVAVLTEPGWRLASVTSEQLDRWELDYY